MTSSLPSEQSKLPEEIELIRASIETTKGGLEAMMKAGPAGHVRIPTRSLFRSTYQNARSENPRNKPSVHPKNAAILHYVKTNEIMEADELVPSDLGADRFICKRHLADDSRGVGNSRPGRGGLPGGFGRKQKCIAYLKPASSGRNSTNMLGNCLRKARCVPGLIKDRSELHKYYWHSIGHFIGLEYPRSRG